jgi:hypothetical protein
MSKVEQLRVLLSEMHYPSMMEVLNCAWYRNGEEEIHWNTDDNLEDLENGDGDTYCGSQTESYTEWEGYLVVNLDTDMGYWMTYLFPLDKEVIFE